MNRWLDTCTKGLSESVVEESCRMNSVFCMFVGQNVVSMRFRKWKVKRKGKRRRKRRRKRKKRKKKVYCYSGSNRRPYDFEGQKGKTNPISPSRGMSTLIEGENGTGKPPTHRLRTTTGVFRYSGRAIVFPQKRGFSSLSGARQR